MGVEIRREEERDKERERERERETEPKAPLAAQGSRPGKTIAK